MSLMGAPTAAAAAAASSSCNLKPVLHQVREGAPKDSTRLFLWGSLTWLHLSNSRSLALWHQGIFYQAFGRSRGHFGTGTELICYRTLGLGSSLRVVKLALVTISTLFT